MTSPVDQDLPHIHQITSITSHLPKIDGWHIHFHDDIDDEENEHDHPHWTVHNLNFKERVHHFTWSWYTMTMATGGIANIL